MAQIITKVPKEALGEGKDTERQRCSTIPYRPTCPDIPQCVRKGSQTLLLTVQTILAVGMERVFTFASATASPGPCDQAEIPRETWQESPPPEGRDFLVPPAWGTPESRCSTPHLLRTTFLGSTGQWEDTAQGMRRCPLLSAVLRGQQEAQSLSFQLWKLWQQYPGLQGGEGTWSSSGPQLSNALPQVKGEFKHGGCEALVDKVPRQATLRGRKKSHHG